MSSTSPERGFSSPGGNKPASTAGLNKRTSPDAAAQVSGAVRELATETKEQAASVADSAERLASQAGEKLMSSVEEQKAAGADFVSGMAGAIRRAANEFGEVPQAQHYIRRAADQIDSVSNAFRNRDLNQLMSDVQGFARRQPTAFLGAAVLTGFALVRFLKTSTAASRTNPSARSQGYGSDFASGSGYTGRSSGNWPTDTTRPVM